jgi:hypothetical protein
MPALTSGQSSALEGVSGLMMQQLIKATYDLTIDLCAAQR